MGDSGLEILHGGVGRDVEQGAQTSKHILDFAFDPLVSALSLFTFVQSIILHSYLFACVVPCIIHIAISCICLVVCVCLTCI